MTSFDYQPRTRIVFAPGELRSLGKHAAELGARRALVVSDPGIVAAGHTERGLRALHEAGIETHLFDGVAENPTTDHITAGVTCAHEFRPDLLVGLGGGSSMDCAKGINFVYSCGGQMQDYWGVGKATCDMLPMIAVPTTAGTGSEAQSFALISDAETHIKMACGDKRAACRIAILDPELTLTQPSRVTALTGIDALSHALETYVTRRRNAISLTFSRAAWRLLSQGFVRVLHSPDDLAARGNMQLGACFAGMAIENSMLGGTHALANPLTAKCGIAHGQAIALMLPHVVRFNAVEVGNWYEELLQSCVAPGQSPHTTLDDLVDFIGRCVRSAGLAECLSACGVDREELPELAAASIREWTSEFNPRQMSEADALKLYETAY